MPVHKHEARKGAAAREDARGGHRVLGRLRSAIARAFAGSEREPGSRTWEALAPQPRSALEESRRREHQLRLKRERDRAAEAAVMAAHRERALRRVAAAAGDACEDWSQGLDLDEAMLRLRAELQSAAEFDA
jgi:hypothetical protein